MLQSHTYALDYGQLAGLTIGCPKQAEVTLVFLHGWLDNAASFQTVIEALHPLAPNWALCAIDLPGHGLSSHKSSASYYPFHDYIDDIYQLLLTISPNRLILVGHSLGALIASCYSAVFPEQVAGLVQIEGLAPLIESPENSLVRWRKGVISRHRLRRKSERYYSSLPAALQHRARVNQLPMHLLEPIVRRGIWQVEGKWQWRYDKKLTTESLYRQSLPHAQQVMEQIVCPHLVILGEHGFASLEQDVANYWHAKMEKQIISGGHHCHLQQPLQVAELIFGLVNKI
ncbi:alpha/beta fold hydrolase [Vibrio sp. V27_P1S3P104]|nr:MULTISPECIES: alpha/beta hydrolase [unclassified Vibrio]NAW69427.1 alpha/beta fold hydrolase [Vibrio sp. V28_P6S34P95]NAX05800.1 alpha/beta fold hydrolase [Vibrio sp. V30_P3S12P165]NAX34151.1 alpha/beta fold hydrolase [Vibrio sp. V29_P1S30P107]NAX38428.1 alpha/beta fold hydrolase [Vibrio sp. V27_P1S3P104]NAX40820.1 alpha/beta fold hydrolase [Vibrio sp. V26_P1S5P106]